MFKWFGYKLATKNPRVPLRVANLVYQGGIPNTPIQDIAGGGNVPRNNQPYGAFRPVVMSRTLRSTGLQGMVPWRPPTVTPLGLAPELQNVNAAAATNSSSV